MYKDQLHHDNIQLATSKKVPLTNRNFKVFTKKVHEYQKLFHRYEGFDSSKLDVDSQKVLYAIGTNLLDKSRWYENELCTRIDTLEKIFLSIDSLDDLQSHLDESVKLKELSYVFKDNTLLQRKSSEVSKLYWGGVQSYSTLKKPTQATQKNSFFPSLKKLFTIGLVATIGYGLYQSTTTNNSKEELTMLPNGVYQNVYGPLPQPKKLLIHQIDEGLLSVNVYQPITKEPFTPTLEDQKLIKKKRNDSIRKASLDNIINPIKEAIHPLDSLISTTIINESTYLWNETESWFKETKKSLSESLSTYISKQEKKLKNQKKSN